MTTYLKDTFGSALVRSLWNQELIPFVGVFVVYLASAKIGHYFFFSIESSPAVIWPVGGVALAAILIGGYRMWVPIALAQLVSAFTSPATPTLMLIAASTIGNVVQPLIGAYFLKTYGFTGKMDRIRDALLLICAAFAVTMILPTLTSLTQYFAGTLTQSLYFVWSRAWAGGILSVIIFTPFITTWFPLRPVVFTRKDVEILAAFGLLFVFNFGLFWTTLSLQGFGLFLFYGLLITLFWIAMRMEPRTMAFALMLTLFIGVAGAYFFEHPDRTVSERLLSTQLFVELIAAIFFIFSSAAAERRNTLHMLRNNMTELNRSIKELDRADKAKNEFIAILAHELRNPLAPIMNTLEILKMKNTDSESATLIAGAEQQAYVMRRLLDDLLDVSRVAQKKFKLQVETIKLSVAVRHVVESIRAFLESSGHTLEVKLPDSEVLIRADLVRFEQILMNLMNNAVKYTPRGGLIRLHAHIEKDFLVVTVSDTGIGISKTDLEHIFLPFRQIDSASSRAGTGLGIGLSLTKRLVEMHGGTVEAQSDGMKKGSRFIIRMPLPPPGVLAGEAGGRIKKNYKLESIMKILIVDDNQAAAQSLGTLLNLKGHTTRIVFTGTEALEAASLFEPDVILLDIGLPDFDGYEVSRRLKSNQAASQTFHLIALTGYGQHEDKLKAKEAGFDYHLTKPIRITELESIFAQIESPASPA